jgi:membrane-anchored protein YejM (alkaline phosphatase superfamily)
MKISRRKFIVGCGATIATLGVAKYCQSIYRHKNALNKPNIILFIADDMRFDAVGFAGNSIIQTPNLDKLASTGVVFDNHFVTTSICPTKG